MLSELVRSRAKGLVTGVALFFLRFGLTPNVLTLIGFLMTAGVAAVIGAGHLVLAGVLLIVSLGFDAVDGTAARLTGRSTPFGAFLDSTLDRWAEGALFFGLWIQALERDRLLVLLTFLALIGSFMVSYTRARAEGLGLTCQEGLLTRFERMAILVAGLVLTGWFGSLPLQIAIGAIAVFAHITAIQRVVSVRRQLQS